MLRTDRRRLSLSRRAARVATSPRGRFEAVYERPDTRGAPHFVACIDVAAHRRCGGWGRVEVAGSLDFYWKLAHGVSGFFSPLHLRRTRQRQIDNDPQVWLQRKPERLAEGTAGEQSTSIGGRPNYVDIRLDVYVLISYNASGLAITPTPRNPEFLIAS